jgi:hypothetical protein
MEGEEHGTRFVRDLYMDGTDILLDTLASLLGFDDDTAA